MTDDPIKDYFVVATKRHKPCLIYHGFRYVQDKIQNRTIYWRCEDRAHCNGRAHQLNENGSLPVLTIQHNHRPIMDEFSTSDAMLIYGQFRQQRRRLPQASHDQQRRHGDDLLLSSTSSTMTSPVKLENHATRQQHFPNQHGPLVPNLHLSEVITTAAATNPHYYNGTGAHRQNSVDPIEMTKLLSNITTANNSASKTIPISSTMDYTSRLNQFAWEEIEGRYLPVVFRNEHDSLHRYTSKMYVENTLFQSESWQRHALLARSLPPLISFPYTDHELKLFRLIVEWHLASFHFKTILPSDCLIRFDDLLDFYGALRKLRDTSSTTSFTRPLPPPPIPPPMSMPPSPKQRPPPSSNGLAQSFKLPTMGGNSAIKSHRPPSSTKVYPPALHRQHSPNYLLQQNADLLASFCNSSAPVFNFNSLPPKPTLPPTPQWTEPLLKSAEKLRPPLPRPMIPMPTPSLPSQEQLSRDKHSLPPKYRPSSNPNAARETKESGWVQINNVFVPYIVKLKLPRDQESEKCSTRQPAPQLQREFFVPYEILIKCNIFSDNEFSFKKLLVKATQQDFDIFDSLIANINIFDEKVPEKTFLVNLHHAMIGLQRILYVKFLTTKQPRSQVNKYHAEVLTHKGGTLLMHGNRLVPYIVQNNRSYVPLLYAYQTLPHVLSQAKRGARAPRQYEIEYLNLLLIYFSIDSPPLTSDTLLVDAFTIKSADVQLPIHFRTLVEHHQYEKSKLSNTLMRSIQTNSETLKASSSQKSNKFPPANVVVNPLIHHPSFYGLPSSTSAIKQPPQPSPSHPVAANPFFFPPTASKRKSHLKTIKYDNHSLSALIKSSDQSINESKISLRDIFREFAFEINYEKFIQWCQNNLLLPLVRLDEEEKQILNQNHSHEEFYVYYRHLNRSIELLNDLKRGTISMTLLPQPSSTAMNHETIPVKSQLAGAKKRKTTVPTTRHIHPPPFQSSPIPNENPSHLPELPIAEERLQENPLAIVNCNDEDNSMPMVDTVEEEQSIPVDLNASFIVAESNDCDDGKVHLDDTLPSCSSGYESSAALTNLDVHPATHPSSSDDEETNSTTRSRGHSSSCQSEQSLAPILSAVSSNIQLNAEQDNHRLSPILTNEKSLHIRLRTKNSHARSRSRSPTPRANKKKRLSDQPVGSSAATTITSDQIEHHLRTLLMPVHEQKRTRTRPIKTPTRLVEEIPHTNHHSTKHVEAEERTFSPPPSTTTDANTSEANITNHQSCVYNVTISNKPNKLGFTIKKVIPR